ncbi:hypothetical protein BDW62DRAFT_211512 [Aspergillus aurantiobrunneus]
MASSSQRPAMDCYEILEISPDASLKDINNAYKKLALKHHPDKAGGVDAANKFQKIQEAVEILRDPAARQAHDSQLGRRHKRPSEEELLFARPEYKGWRPNGMYRNSFSRRDRYMFSYRESVHIDPYSAESQEELARCERARKEEAEMRENQKQENIRRATELPAEDVAKAAEPRKPPRSVLNPEAENFSRKPQYHGCFNDGAYNGVEPLWWAGAEPNGDHGVPDADAGVDDDFTSEAEERPRPEPKSDAEPVNGSNSTVDAEFKPDIEADVHAVPDLNADNESEVEPVVIIEPGPEYHAKFDLDTISGNSWTDELDAADIEIDITMEKDPQLDYEPDNETDTDADSVADELVSVHTESSERAAAEHPSASPGHLLQDMMSGTFPSSSGELENRADANSTGNADHGSSESIYYDFSDPVPSQSDNQESEIYHELPTSSDSVSSGNSRIPQLHIAEFNEANVYPYLAPFIPYFTRKLTDKNCRYTREDFRAELRGIIMETYCGWLETVRVTIPGVAESVKAHDPRVCRHLGYWEKKLGCKICEVCELWRPIYTLVCPGCGIKSCFCSTLQNCLFVWSILSFRFKMYWACLRLEHGWREFGRELGEGGFE